MSFTTETRPSCHRVQASSASTSRRGGRHTTRQVRLLAALAIFAASVAAIPVSATAQEVPEPLSPADCSTRYVPAHIRSLASRVNEFFQFDPPENRSGLVAECMALVAIRNHFASNPANVGNDWFRSQSPYVYYTDTMIFQEGGQISIMNLGGLTGTIPPELGNLTNLTALDLTPYESFQDGQYTKLGSFTGPIPPELGNLTNLERLRLEDNQLTGAIPAELGNLTNLTALTLHLNRLTGEIPAELGNLTNLGWFTFCPNRLTGAMPSQLRDLVDWDYRSWSGPVFEEWFDRWQGPADLDDLASFCRLDVNTPFEGRFSDDEGSVHEDSIEQIAQWGITTGCEENRFCPQRTVNRSQMSAFLYRAVTHLHRAPDPGGEVRLSDVADDAWYRTNAQWAVNNGVMRAPGGSFNPRGAVTRADMAEMLVAAFDHISAPARAQGLFSDTAGFSDAAVRAMEGIRAAGVTAGCATNPLRYCPSETVTRAQMASFLTRAIQAADAGT